MISVLASPHGIHAIQDQTPPSAAGDQRKPSSPRFEPRPPSPRAGDRNAAHQPQLKSSRRDALLAWQKRGAAVAHPATTAKAGRAFPTEANHRPLPAWRLLRDREEMFPQKKKTDREVEQPIINNASSKNSISPLAQIRSRSLTSRG